MSVAWTEEQKKVIELRDRNILVAAAAGSGKTAVLVERILSRITDPENPVNVDELLIVTFTRAAAAEMRERIGQALKSRLIQTPENIHLQRQLTLLHYAQITTIDSFCLHVLRSHFDVLDLDPDFRIADEGELKMLRGDLIEKLMDDCYAEEHNDAFHELVETMAVDKGDGGIAELIERLYGFVNAYPFPDEILRRWGGEDDTPLGEQEWMQFLLEQLHREAQELIGQYDSAIKCCMEADGPSGYVDMFLQDRELARSIMQACDYESLMQALDGLVFSRKPVIRDKTVDPEKKESLSAFRDDRKKIMQKWKEQYFFPDREQMLAQLRKSEGPLHTLCDLTGRFIKRFAAGKKEKHLVDFSDLEHLALQILVERKEDGTVVPSAVARQLQGEYREVMIDEYQDSNLVQEMILSSVAGHWCGRPNRFMVGDVKQSIYKFRMARPEIFMEKYTTFSTQDSENQKIDLHKNFRSRPQVLDAANYVFCRLMSAPIGGIDYDEQNALNAGAVFPEQESTDTEAEKADTGKYDYTTELLLVDLSDEDGYCKEVDAREAEAKAIAMRIRELTDEKTGLSIWDKEQKCYRTARYGDIVILLRTFTGWAEPFANVLLNAGVPAYAQSSVGYFTALEVQTVLNCLRILDNPMQDIPLAAVLHSAMGGFSSEELARLKAAFKKAGSPGDVRGLYGACLYAAALYREDEAKNFSSDQPAAVSESEEAFSEEMKELGKKTARFLEEMEALRRKAVFLPLHELLAHVYTDTGYYELVSVMPDAAVRRANLDMLMEKAIAYESTSYYGLFDFVRYIEQLHKYDVDFGEASPEGEGGNTVCITTIHKSKGLEYPIVFVAGTGKLFNRQDMRSRILMHPDLGLAADCMDTELRLRVPTLKKQVLAKKLGLDNMGEELRVLYVAMTRAREKLILTGTDRYLTKKLAAGPAGDADGSDKALPSSLVAGAGSYLDWLLLCLSPIRKNASGLFTSYGEAPIRCHVIPFTRLLFGEVENQVVRREVRRALDDWDSDAVYDALAREALETRLHFSYRYADDETLPVKVSVSELKHAAMEEEPESCRLVELQEESTLPRFLQKTGSTSGASRGTAYHKALERMDFVELSHWAEEGRTEPILHRLRAWQQAGILTAAEADAIDPRGLLRLGKTVSAGRMAAAQSRGQLWREKPFVMGLPAGEVYPEKQSEELVVIQGIIDIYWEEDGALYLLDYKTDRVPTDGGEEILKSRYRKQLSLYARALCAATGLPVRQKIIYSFALGQEIELED